MSALLNHSVCYVHWLDYCECLKIDHREKSLELKHSFSCPSPTIPLENESPLRQTPPHHFKVPYYPSRSKRHTPKQRKPRPQRSHPYQHLELDYPSLPTSNTQHSPCITSSPHAPISYAQATQCRAGKRSATERICLSPIDHVPKRHALQLTPCEPLLSQPNGTLQDHLTDELMEVCDPNECTPGSERSVRPFQIPFCGLISVMSDN